METALEFLREMIKAGITPLEIFTVLVLVAVWRQHREERREWREFMQSITTRYETLLNENIQSLAIIDAKLDKQD